MQHVESSVKIYFTSDYARFRMINGNRPLNEKKIKKIIKDIEEGTNILPYAPVICFDKGDVLTAKEYLSMIENVFNYNKAKRTTIY